jgi:predicted MFS family arabinose efflux permease
MIGWILDRAGGMSAFGWGLAFLHVAIVALIGQIAFMALRPRDLAGDRSQPTGR